MKRIILHIALFFILAWPFGLQADDNVPLLPSEGELQLIQLINESRRQPLAVAESYGKTSTQAIVDFPELSGILEIGLKPLSTHQSLLGSALAHAKDMLENNYYSKSSRDGSSPLDRMETYGYIAAQGNSLLGMLAFRNYMDEAKAIRLIFRTMFLDELDPEYAERRCILDPTFTDIGVSVKTGQWEINNEILNIYMVVCDFGATAINDAEATLMVLINQARRYPIQQMRALEIEPSAAFSAVPYLPEYTTSGMPPVIMDKKLYWTANSHGWEMLDMDYLSSESLEGLTPEQRIMKSGYPAQTAGEVYRSLSTTNPIEASISTGVHFERLLKRELDPKYSKESIILNPVFRDAGPSVILSAPVAQPDDDEASLFDKYFVNILVCDFASKATDDQHGGVYGWVYSDMNLNGLFDPGEGISRASVKLKDVSGKLIFDSFADSVGGFHVKLCPGEYLVTVDDGNEKIGRRVNVTDTFLSIPVRVIPDSDELLN